jgi:type II secretory pathway predicted ATPase ExeA
MKYLKAENNTGRQDVMYVIGKSGVGKTKLVRNMYEQHETKHHFDVQVWVSVAPNLSAPSILKLIIQQLEDGNVNYHGEITRLYNLKKVLYEIKYLVVIDGEVSSIEWERILTQLPYGKAGSKVVQITQTRPEASHATW